MELMFWSQQEVGNTINGHPALSYGVGGELYLLDKSESRLVHHNHSCPATWGPSSPVSWNSTSAVRGPPQRPLPPPPKMTKKKREPPLPRTRKGPESTWSLWVWNVVAMQWALEKFKCREKYGQFIHGINACYLPSGYGKLHGKTAPFLGDKTSKRNWHSADFWAR